MSKTVTADPSGAGVIITDAGAGTQVHVPGVVLIDELTGLPYSGFPPRAGINDSTSTAGFTYYCEAAPGSLSSQPVWRISRVSSAGVTTFAGGSASFSNIADNRAALAYS